MTPSQKKSRNTLERAYLTDLHNRKLLVSCPTCKSKKNIPCKHLTGPRKGSWMAGTHAERSLAANRAGLVKGPWYWRSVKSI